LEPPGAGLLAPGPPILSSLHDLASGIPGNSDWIGSLDESP
jgi:hypothetical protein